MARLTEGTEYALGMVFNPNRVQYVGRRAMILSTPSGKRAASDHPVLTFTRVESYAIPDERTPDAHLSCLPRLPDIFRPAREYYD